jgi:arylsulfatase A-like enzyme
MGELRTANQMGKPGYEGYLNKRVVSLAEVLHDGGYHTYMAGKWHLGAEPGFRPHDRGFEKTLSLLYGGASHWSDMDGLFKAQTPVKYSSNGKILEKLPKDFYSSRSYADFIIQSIREDRSDGNPFLAYLAFTAPHDPLHVPEPWLSQYRGAFDDGYEALKQRRFKAAKEQGIVADSAKIPPMHPQVKLWKELSEDERKIQSRMMEVYAGMVSCLDYQLGRVVNYLKDIGEYENTVIIIMSDNGPNPWTTEDYPTNRTTDFMSQHDNAYTKKVGAIIGVGPPVIEGKANRSQEN